MSRASKTVQPQLTGQAELLAMLAFRRPAWSRTEDQFIQRFIEPLGMQWDTFGNLYKRIGDAPVLWSSHTDTVHTQGGKQLLSLARGIITQSDPNSNCLGADCTAGVWLMLEMIRANRPGLYIFHRAEEIGGQGSQYIAECRPKLLADMRYAIAFDRKATKSIITHQGSRCCSETFSTSLSLALGMGHVSDDGGTFTDTANYVDAIGECTNVSVGYQREHTKAESLDLVYLLKLRDALVRLDVSSLVAERQPGEADPDDYCFQFDDDVQDPFNPRYSGSTLLHLVRDNPDAIADWLEEYGITAEEIETALHMRGIVTRR